MAALARLRLVLGRTPRRSWLCTFSLLAILGLGWAAATPVFASPDEPPHTIRAWSVVRGELLGSEFGSSDAPPNPFGPVVIPDVSTSGLSVDAPVLYRGWGQIECLAFQPNVTAECLSLDGAPRVTRVLTTVGRYFPAPYVVYGAATLVTPPGAGQIYLMRVLGVLLGSALLASSLASIASRPRPAFARLGFMIAMTPMAFFLLASVNPSGLEIAAAIAMWTNAAVLAAGFSEGIDHRVVNRLGLALAVLVVMRPASPFVALSCLAALLPVVGRKGAAQVARDRGARRWLLLAFVLTGTHFAWNLVADNTAAHLIGRPVDVGLGEFLRASIGREFGILREMIGVFGWLDTPSPGGTLVLWLVALGAILALSLGSANRRWIGAIGAVLGFAFLAPIALDAITVADAGFIVQGRYILPIAAGFPILAGVAASETAPGSWRTRRLMVSLGGALLSAQVLAFAQALRRYVVGSDGPIWFPFHEVWHPPVPSLLLLVMFTAGAAGAFWWILGSASPSPTRQSAVTAP